MEKAPAKSTITDGNKELLIVDSTTIQLFSNLIFKGVGRNPKNGGRKKGGLKVHMLIDAYRKLENLSKYQQPGCTTVSSFSKSR